MRSRSSSAIPPPLPPALDDVDTVFLLTSETPEQPDHELAVIRQAEAAAVRRVVKLSVWRADERVTPIARLGSPRTDHPDGKATHRQAPTHTRAIHRRPPRRI
jgi:hypothetical protein